jgi:uncharacterized protein (DUF1810 family)
MKFPRASIDQSIYMPLRQGMNESMNEDPFELSRFTLAQEPVFAEVIKELSRGQKDSHWMWFIFPQICGLGISHTAQFYAINSLDEAKAYLAHPVLGPRLETCCKLLLAITGKSVSEILGFPDDLKLRSSMTLFAQATESAPGTVFQKVLDAYFGGHADDSTLKQREKLGRR